MWSPLICLSASSSSCVLHSSTSFSQNFLLTSTPLPLSLLPLASTLNLLQEPRHDGPLRDPHLLHPHQARQTRRPPPRPLLTTDAKHTVSQGQTTGTTLSRNSTTSHTSPSNLPSSSIICGIPSLFRSTLSTPSSPVLQGMNSSRRYS